MFIGGFDMAIMVDASSSIGGQTHLQLVMDFVKSVYHEFLLENGVRYGLVVFGSGIVEVKYPFLLYSMILFYKHYGNISGSIYKLIENLNRISRLVYLPETL